MIFVFLYLTDYILSYFKVRVKTLTLEALTMCRATTNNLRAGNYLCIRLKSKLLAYFGILKL
jgi:hypothetical protein